MMAIVTHPANQAYRDNFDRVFSLRTAYGELRRRPKSNAMGIEPDPSVLDDDGLIKPHPWEEPHDVPGQSTCWHCLYDRDDEIHTKRP
jgi:hypothetical protein